MFIRIHTKRKIALNLNAYDFVEIYEYGQLFVLRLVKKIEPHIEEKATIQSYPTYERAFEDFESMMNALEKGQIVWAPQRM